MTRKVVAIMAGLALCALNGFNMGCDKSEPGDEEMLQRRPVSKEPKRAPSVPEVSVSQSAEGDGTQPPPPE